MKRLEQVLNSGRALHYTVITTTLLRYPEACDTDCKVKIYICLGLLFIVLYYQNTNEVIV